MAELTLIYSLILLFLYTIVRPRPVRIPIKDRHGRVERNRVGSGPAGRIGGRSRVHLGSVPPEAGGSEAGDPAAYSATKFALPGLAEALQQELISDNIHISLIFPPDTDTPGHAIDKKGRPRVTRILASTSSAMKADEVAEKALNGIKRGDFMISCNMIGSVVSIMTAGVSPQRSFLLAFVEVLTSGLLRLLALLFNWNAYRIIR